MFACARKNPKKPEIGIDSSAILAVSLSGFERGATIIFCRACKQPPCTEVCPTGALIPRKGGGVMFVEDKCIACQNCMHACSIGAIFERKNRKPAVCIHCGYCVQFCPHDVLAFVEANE